MGNLLVHSMLIKNKTKQNIGDSFRNKTKF